MNQLFEQLGINWQLFLSQAVNFFILLLILRQFVYKPLLAVIKERNKKIKEGLEKAEEADVRLKEVDGIAKEKLKAADVKSIAMVKETEKRAKELEQTLRQKAEKEHEELMAQAKASYTLEQEKMRADVLAQASELVKQIIVKTVEMKPQEVDEALITKAVKSIANEAKS